MAKMRDIHLFFRLTLYYVVLVVGMWFAYDQVPDLSRHIPLGVVEQMIDSGSDSAGLGDIQIHASSVSSQFGGVLWLVVALLGSIVLMIPVSWVYLAIRQRSKVDQSLLETIIILPVVVTGIVLVVHNSLALAFSLAGVMAGVRFRNALKNTADSVFIFTAVGVGLSAGIGMLLIAAIMTAIFNYTFLILWTLNYGGFEEAKHYMRKARDEKVDDPGVFD